jgi:hypothetical protein
MSSPYLSLPVRSMVEVIRDRHLEREAAGDKSREHLERGMLLDEVDRLRVELVTRPSAIEQAAPAVMLAVCACVWGSVALVWLR